MGEERVVATETALRTALDLQSSVGQLRANLRDLRRIGLTLAEPSLWDGPAAATFRGDAWPKVMSAVEQTLRSLESLPGPAEQVVQDVLKAGSSGLATGPVNVGAGRQYMLLADTQPSPEPTPDPHLPGHIGDLQGDTSDFDFNDPTKAPGKGWVREGPNWYNPETKESLHPDLGHGGRKGPHWDYQPRFWNRKGQVNPDGSITWFSQPDMPSGDGAQPADMAAAGAIVVGVGIAAAIVLAPDTGGASLVLIPLFAG